MKPALTLFSLRLRVAGADVDSGARVDANDKISACPGSNVINGTVKDSEADWNIGLGV